MKNDEMMKILGGLINTVKRDSFVDGYDATDKEAFAILMSIYFQWCGYDIAETAVEALRDANFGELADNIEEALNTEIARA